MFTKHFLKTLIMFVGIIALGLLGAFLVSHFDLSSKPAPTPVETMPCCKSK